MAGGASPNLEALFKPTAVAVVGASADGRKLGGAVLRALIGGNFLAPVLPVNPRRISVSGVLCYRSVSQLPMAPDVAVVCTPPNSVPGLIAELGRRGCRVAIVMTGDPENTRDGGTSRFAAAILEAARPFGLRVVGPGSTGIQVPGIGFNCTWIPTPALSGRVALISQSGSLAAGVVDWARARGVGFSHIISAGDAIDLDVGDYLDVLTADPSCQAILLYIRSVTDARKFLSAARAAARWKRVIVVKAGRRNVPVPDAANGTGISADEAFDAAIRRAGMLRVATVDELFDAVETLASGHTVRGDSLAILSNGFGPASLAAVTMCARGGRLAPLTEATWAALDEAVPGRHLRDNPVDIGRGASATQFAAAARALLADPGADALLVMRTGTDLQPPEDSAAAVIRMVEGHTRAVLACWQGDVPAVRALFAAAGIPAYDTPDRAARGFLHLAGFYRNQEMLLQIPERPPALGPEQRHAGAALVTAALDRGERSLGLDETGRLLTAYGIHQPEARLAADADDAERHAVELGFPVAVRLLQPTSGGRTVLNLWGPQSVRATVLDLLARFARCHPDLETPPVVVQRTPGGSGLLVLAAGVGIDTAFGPMIQVGASNQRDRDSEDHALALPPLNMHLAAELLGRTRLGRRLRGGAPEPSEMERAVQTLLVNLSQLIVDIPEIAAVDLDPVVIEGGRVSVVRAAIALAPQPGPERQLAIKPYPEDLEETACLADGTMIRLRPIRPEDTPAYERMLRQLNPADMRMRFFGVFTALPRSQLTTLIHIDYDRDMTFVATQPGPAGAEEEIIGTANILVSPRTRSGEYAVLARSDQKGRRLGRVLMEKMIRHARAKGLTTVIGIVHKDNHAMLDLCRKLGFVVPSMIDDYFDGFTDGAEDEDRDDVVEVRLELEEATASS